VEKLLVKATIKVDGNICGWEREECQFRYENDNGVWCSLYRFEPVRTEYFKSFLGYREIRCDSCLQRKDLSK